MNTDKHKNSSFEKYEERIVALLLGEVDETERRQLEEAIRDNSDLLRFYEEMQKTIGLIQQVSSEISKVVENKEDIKPQSLSPERRRILLNYFRRPAVKAETRKNTGFQISLKFAAYLCLVFLGLSILVALMLPSLGRTRAKATHFAENNNQEGLSLERRLIGEELRKKNEAKFVEVQSPSEEASFLSQQPTIGNVLSESLYRRELQNQPESQTTLGDNITKQSDSKGVTRWEFGAGGGIAGGYGARGVSGAELSKRIGELRRDALSAEPRKPAAPTEGISSTAPPPLTLPPASSPAIAGPVDMAKEKLAESPAGATAVAGRIPTLGTMPRLGREFSDVRDTERTRVEISSDTKPDSGGQQAQLNFFYSDRKARLSDYGKKLEDTTAAFEQAGVGIKPSEGMTGLAVDELKQQANGVVIASTVEKEALKLEIPRSSFKGTPSDLSAETRSLAKAAAKVAELDKDVAGKKEAELDAYYDAPTKRPAEMPKVIQPEIITSENRFSTFSLNVSDVSFKTALASIQNRVLPGPNSIREEEFINAFNYNDPAPPRGAKIGFYWERARYPFAHNRDIVRFSVQTASLGRGIGKPMNLVILLDNSGSMERPDRVAIVSEAMKVLAHQLRPGDKISVIAFARTPRLIIDGMVWGDPTVFLNRVLNLNPHGGTNLEDAMKLGYSTAIKHFIPGGINRVILLTDGAANLGEVDPEILKNLVITNRQKGIALDCFGIGWEGYNDELLEVLSRNGDGRYGFMNEPEKAPIEFAEQLTGALKIAAADVKVQIEFNPARVISYRQIGYTKHQLTKEQFRDNTVDAAEIGEAQSGNALYIIQVNPNGSGNIGFFRVRYKDPETGNYHEREWSLIYQPNVPPLEQASPTLRLAAAAGIFAEWLAQNPYSAHVNLIDLERLMTGVPEVFAPDQRPRQLLTMINQTRAITGK